MAKEITNNDIEHSVTQLIHTLGIPAHLKGYHYLRTAIIYAAQNVELLDGMTKNLYPLIAEKFNSTVVRVERSIRNSIEVAWYRGGEKAIRQYMGTKSGKPTNSEFISLAADRIRLQYKLY